MTNQTLIICLICALCGHANAEYIIAIKNGDGMELVAQAPAGTRVVDFSVWREVPQDAKQYNPAYYPSVIDTSTGMQAQTPGSWTNAIAILTPPKPYTLCLAENALIGLLRKNNFIDADATAIPDGMTQTVEQYIIISAVSNDSVDVSNFIARFQGLRSTIESYGADPEQAVWHNDLEAPQ